jgi:hypothetical protein
MHDDQLKREMEETEKRATHERKDKSTMSYKNKGTEIMQAKM